MEDMDEGKSHGMNMIAKRKSEDELNESSDQKRSALQMTAEPLVDTDGSSSDIRVLNDDDCLMHIFSFLTIKERIGIERVCKHWQECSMQMWHFTKHLDFAGLIHKSKLTTDILRQVTDRCGLFIQSLDISYTMYGLEVEAVLKVVAGKCPNLRCLNASGFNLQNKLTWLYGFANQLQRVIFNECSLTDEDLDVFFPLCPSLTSVSLADNNKLTSRSLCELNSEVEELTIDKCHGIYRSLRAQRISRLKCLKKLSMNDMDFLDLRSVILNDIFKNLTQLETLCMDMQGYQRNYGVNVQSLSHLTGLVSLSLNGNKYVNGGVLREISVHCKNMERLDISGNDITDVGIEYVARMTKLVDLKMSSNHELTDRALASLADEGRLKKLHCHCCHKLTDFGCSRLVSMCYAMEQFGIGCCERVTMDFVLAANTSVKLRTSQTATFRGAWSDLGGGSLERALRELRDAYREHGGSLEGATRKRRGVALTLLVGGTSIKENLVPDYIDPQLHLDFSAFW